MEHVTAAEPAPPAPPASNAAKPIFPSLPVKALPAALRAAGLRRITPGAPVLDDITIKKLRKGKLDIDARIDLHGMNEHAAHDALLRFVKQARRDDARIVLIITGKGKAGEGVLRRTVPLWFGEAVFKPLIGGWRKAHPAHGGEGALYVRLRREATGDAMTPLADAFASCETAKGVTQKEMAQALGVSAAWLSALENGQARPARLGVHPAGDRLFQRHLGRCRRIAGTGAHFASAHRRRHRRARARKPPSSPIWSSERIGASVARRPGGSRLRGEAPLAEAQPLSVIVPAVRVRRACR